MCISCRNRKSSNYWTSYIPSSEVAQSTCGRLLHPNGLDVFVDKIDGLLRIQSRRPLISMSISNHSSLTASRKWSLGSARTVVPTCRMCFIHAFKSISTKLSKRPFTIINLLFWATRFSSWCSQTDLSSLLRRRRGVEY